MKRSSSDLEGLMPDHFSGGVPAKLHKLQPAAIEAIKKLYYVAFPFLNLMLMVVCMPAGGLHVPF